MSELLTVANWMLPLAYLLILFDYASAFFLRIRTRGVNRWVPSVVAMHAVYLLLLSQNLGRAVGVTNFEVLSVIAMATALVYFIVELASRDRRTGVFVFAAVFVFQYTASVFLLSAGVAADVPAGRGLWHMLPATLAYTAFTLAAVYGALHLLARSDLKQRRVGVLFDRLPPLERLAKMCWFAMLAGFVLITVSIATGAVLAAIRPAGGGIEAKVLGKILVGSTAWVIYAIAVFGRTALRWSSTATSRIAVNGFVLVIVLLILSIVLS